MKISKILDQIDSGHMAMPEFKRGYVWNRDHVRGLFDSPYKRRPVGGLLDFSTESQHATPLEGRSPEVFCFTSTLFFHPYVQKQILSVEAAA